MRVLLMALSLFLLCSCESPRSVTVPVEGEDAVVVRLVCWSWGAVGLGWSEKSYPSVEAFIKECYPEYELASAQLIVADRSWVISLKKRGKQ